LLSLEDTGTAGDRSEAEAAWHEEIARRVDDVVDGKVELVDAEDSRARVRALFDRLRA
jgi:hypothetical protein